MCPVVSRRPSRCAQKKGVSRWTRHDTGQCHCVIEDVKTRWQLFVRIYSSLLRVTACMASIAIFTTLLGICQWWPTICFSNVLLVATTTILCHFAHIAVAFGASPCIVLSSRWELPGAVCQVPFNRQGDIDEAREHGEERPSTEIYGGTASDGDAAMATG
jgi:hypothetical protein